MTVTADQVHAAMVAEGITRVGRDPCAECGAWSSYVLAAGALDFDPGCACVPFGIGLRPDGFESAADWINTQVSVEVRRHLAARFGVTL
jgi:hypothetical protein